MSGELALSQVTANQANKEVTLNTIASQLESAIASVLALDLTTNQGVSVAQLQRCGQIIVTKSGANSQLTLAPTKRLIAVNNQTTNAVSVIVGNTTKAVAANAAALFVLDGTTNGLASISGGGVGSSTLAGLTDVDLTTNAPGNGQVLTYNSTSGKWVPTTISAGSGSSNAKAFRYWKLVFDNVTAGNASYSGRIAFDTVKLAAVAGAAMPQLSIVSVDNANMTKWFNNTVQSNNQDFAYNGKTLSAVLDFTTATQMVELRLSPQGGDFAGECANTIVLSGSQDNVTYTPICTLTYDFPATGHAAGERTRSIIYPS